MVSLLKGFSLKNWDCLEAKYLSGSCYHLHVSFHRKPSDRLGAVISGDSQELELPLRKSIFLFLYFPLGPLPLISRTALSINGYGRVSSLAAFYTSSLDTLRSPKSTLESLDASVSCCLDTRILSIYNSYFWHVHRKFHFFVFCFKSCCLSLFLVVCGMWDWVASQCT